jgi:hypothetical protein
MTIRSFIFCDFCNPMAMRLVEVRRSGNLREERLGRRISDGRMWFEGSLSEASELGWEVNDMGQHICPVCTARHRELNESK